MTYDFKSRGWLPERLSPLRALLGPLAGASGDLITGRAAVEVSGITTLDTGSFDEERTIVVVRSEDGWKIAAWRVMTFDETLLDMMRNSSPR